MDTIAVSQFKATCLAVLERVRRTGKPVLVTRFGKPLAEIVPPPPPPRSTSWLGCLAEKGKVQGDIVAPVVDAPGWEVLDK